MNQINLMILHKKIYLLNDIIRYFKHSNKLVILKNNIYITNITNNNK